MALIELDLHAPPPTESADLPPAYLRRRAGLALAVVLLLLLGGAAPVTSVLWQRVGTVPVPAGGDFQLIGGTLFTVDLNARPRVLTAWQARPVRRLWSFRAPTEVDPFFVRSATPGYAVLRIGRGITVIDARTGAVAWTSLVGVQPVTDDLAFVQEERFRPGTTYDPESGDPGQLYGTGTGTLHTEPAQSTDLRGVALGTGRPVWSRSWPGVVSATLTDRPRRAVVVLAGDRLLVLSALDGRTLRERAVPRIDGGGARDTDVVGDVVLVHYGQYEGGPVVAYGLDDLAELWRQDQPDPDGNSASCVGVVCVRERDRLTVLDPRTGAPRWRLADGDIVAFGRDRVLQMQAMTTPLRTADLVTGRPDLDLRSWTAFFPVEGGDAYLLSHLTGRRTTEIGLLTPGAAAVQPLGVLPGLTGQCQPVPGLAACRLGDAVQIWAYRD